MIWFALAHAVSPEALKASMPDAREQLLTCETEGCTAEEGARAAFILGVGTYLETGEADGELAATVKALDPGRFEDLPEVLRDATTAPAPWVADLQIEWEGETAIAGSSVRFERVRMPPVQPNPLGVTVVVEDETGAPIPGIQLRVEGDPSLYRVDPVAGWSGGGRRSREATELFEKGDMVEFSLFAPGFQRTRAMVLLSKNPKRNRFTLRMVPLVPVSDGSVAGDAVVAAWSRWTDAERAADDQGTPGNEQAAERARTKAARAAVAWAEAGGDARELCESTGVDEVCAP